MSVTMYTVKHPESGLYYEENGKAWTPNLVGAVMCGSENGARQSKRAAVDNTLFMKRHRDTWPPESKKFPPSTENLEEEVVVQKLDVQESPDGAAQTATTFATEYDREPQAGDIALCGINTLGVITHDEPQPTQYENGETAKAYVGLHLEDHPDKNIVRGDQWSSKDPEIITTVEGLRDYAAAQIIARKRGGIDRDDLEPLPGTKG